MLLKDEMTRATVKHRTRHSKRHVTADSEPLAALYQDFSPITGLLTIYDGKKKIWSGRAKAGDTFTVTYEDGEYSVTRQKTPRKKHMFLMWIFGFPLKLSSESPEDFESLVEENRAKHEREEGYSEFTYAGHGYTFAFYTTANELKPQRIAAYVYPEVDRKKAKEILSIKGLNIAAMEDFYGDTLGQALVNKFGFRPDDFTEVNKRLLF